MMMTSGLSSPLEALANLQRAIDRASRSDFFGFDRAYGQIVYPTINVFKDGDTFVLQAELPGLGKEDVNIDVKHDQVRIYGERKKDFGSSEVSVHRLERQFGKFDRSIRLPFTIEPERTQASLQDGVLTITLREPEAAKAKKISIS
jgi:HSP20 family protein